MLLRAGTAMQARLAQGGEDLARALALRGQAFARDAGGDPLDERAAHLLVEAADGRLLATVRILLLPQGADLGESYSARFYDLAALQADPRPLAELGRLAVLPGAEGWQALRLLWGGVARLVSESGAARLLGCASFPGADWRLHRDALGLLAARHLGPAHLRPGRRGDAVDFPVLCADAMPERAVLPPLLRFYTSLGGWVSDHAVADHQLDTLHVLTCLEISSLPPASLAGLKRLANI